MENIRFIRVNPAAEADLRQMNEIIKQNKDYIYGLEFTYSQWNDDNSVQFFYDYPEDLSELQIIKVKELIQLAYSQVLAARKPVF